MDFVFPNELNVTWTVMIVLYPYITGLVAGAFIVSSLYHVFGRHELKPVARNNVAICTNICCMLMGSTSIVEHVENKLGIKVGESTDDGRIYLKKEEECLAACAGGPMMQVNHVYYENLTPEKVDEILDSLE